MKPSSIAQIGKALSHIDRVHIIRMLDKNSWMSVGAIAEKTPCSIASASKHLFILQLAHIVERSREGTTIFYRLRKPRSVFIRATLGA